MRSGGIVAVQNGKRDLPRLAISRSACASMAVQSIVDMAIFQQLQIGELDGLQGFDTALLVVEQDGRRPIGDEQIAATVA